MSQDQVQAADCYRYDPDGGPLVYTDPHTRKEYVLDESGKSWVAKSKDPYEFDGTTYFYVDKSTGVRHVWDLDKHVWKQVDCESSSESTKVASSDSQGLTQRDGGQEEAEQPESEEDDTTTDAARREKRLRKRKGKDGWGTKGSYSIHPDTGAHLYKDETDGMTYEWDSAKNAWFPLIDDNFMAHYQMSYGFNADGTPQATGATTEASTSSPTDSPQPQPPAPSDMTKVAKKSDKKPQWFEESLDKTTKVYVSNLPMDFTDEKFVALMSKCGVLDVDVRTNKPKIKLYRDSNGMLKGDALCTYVKVESVQLALTILDGSTVYEGDDAQKGLAKCLKVERAKFEMKGQAYDPSLKPKKMGKKELERAKKRKDKLLAWMPDQVRGMRRKTDKVIVIENVFDSNDFDQNAALILECSSGLREHCSKFGKVNKVVVYDKHELGVCQVFFSCPEEADLAISMLNGRIFSAKCGPMKAYVWDGKTKYKQQETAAEERERLDNWNKYLTDDQHHPCES